MPETVIIGAGPTGIGAALRLEQLGGHDWVLLEQQDTPGGLSGSVVDDAGFTWDMGVHVPFSHYQYFDQLLDEVVPDWNQLLREAWILLGKRWIPYPFQSNIHLLAREDQKRCLQGLVQRSRLVPANFQQWIHYNFGQGIAELFLNPYNLKVWSHPLEELSVEWVGERVSDINLPGTMTKAVDGADSRTWGLDYRFRYPAQGGGGRIWKEAAGLLPPERICYRRQVVSIDTRKKAVTTSQGVYPYEYLISSLPLDLLLKMLDQPVDTGNAPWPIHSSLHVVGLGIEGEPPEALREKSWIYFPQSSTPFHRAAVGSFFSPNNTPGGCWSLQLEISESTKRILTGDPVLQSLEAARRLGLIPADARIVSRFHRRIEHAYPTPYLGRDSFLEQVQPELAARGILSRGRFGGWKYEAGNEDHCLMQGVEAADQIAFGAEEFTYLHPDLANIRRKTARRFHQVRRQAEKARLFENINSDLLPWREDGISRETFDKVKRTPWKGIHVKIVGSKLRVYKEVSSVDTRNQAVTLMLKEVAARYQLPDCEFIIHTADTPHSADLPIFAFCKRPQDTSILFPDYSFCSWLECLTPGIDQAKISLARGHCPWEEKTGRIFFAGSGSHPLRHSLARLKRDFLDIRVSDWTKSRAMFVPLEEHNRWKFLLNLPGKSCSPRLKYLFLTNSLVIQGDTEWVEFWHRILDYGQDCVRHSFSGPRNVDLLYEALSTMSNEECAAMAKRGHEKVYQTLTLDNVYEYIARLIREYATLLRYPVQSQDYRMVIARFDEDISWSDGYPRVIYNKGEKIAGLTDEEQIVLPNVGRDAQTYLTYIIDNYDHLPEYVLFCRGNIRNHVGDLTIESFVNPDYDYVAARFCNVRTWDPTTGRLLHTGTALERFRDGRMRPAGMTCVEWFEKVLDVRVGDSAIYSPGSVFCVSAGKIRSHPIEWYAMLLDFVSDHPDPEESHYLERSWLYIFSDKDTKVLNLA